MRVCKEKKLDLREASGRRIRRSNIADSIDRHWTRDSESCVRIQYLRLVDGRIQPSEYAFERTDILLVQVEGVCNVFIEPDGSPQIDLWDGVEITSEERKDILNYAAKYWHEEKEYVEREKRFLDSQPWKEIYGMTPEEGVKKLRELGW